MVLAVWCLLLSSDVAVFLCLPVLWFRLCGDSPADRWRCKQSFLIYATSALSGLSEVEEVWRSERCRKYTPEKTRCDWKCKECRVGLYKARMRQIRKRHVRQDPRGWTRWLAAPAQNVLNVIALYLCFKLLRRHIHSTSHSKESLNFTIPRPLSTMTVQSAARAGNEHAPVVPCADQLDLIATRNGGAPSCRWVVCRTISSERRLTSSP